MSSKKTKSFADALLSADVPTENIALQKGKIKKKKVHDRSSSNNPQNLNSLKPKQSSSKHRLSDHHKSSKRKDSDLKKREDKSYTNSKAQSSKSCSKDSNFFFNSPVDDFGDDLEHEILASTSNSALNQPFNRSKYGSGDIKPKKSNKILGKILAEEEEQQQKSDMLKSVDEELMLFGRILEGQYFSKNKV